jgi:hypothetical protein
MTAIQPFNRAIFGNAINTGNVHLIGKRKSSREEAPQMVAGLPDDGDWEKIRGEYFNK